MLVPALALAWVGRPVGSDRRDRRARRIATGIAGISALAAGGFAALAPRLPLDDLATRLRPGATISALCAGSGRRAHLPRHAGSRARRRGAAGSCSPMCARLASRRWQRSSIATCSARATESLSEVAVLADFTQEERMELFWRLAPAFDLHEVPAAVLRPLYRRLPRTFFVEEGRVTRTYPGLPPADSLPRRPRTTEKRTTPDHDLSSSHSTGGIEPGLCLPA